MSYSKINKSNSEGFFYKHYYINRIPMAMPLLNQSVTLAGLVNNILVQYEVTKTGLAQTIKGRIPDTYTPTTVLSPCSYKSTLYIHE